LHDACGHLELKSRIDIYYYYYFKKKESYMTRMVI